MTVRDPGQTTDAEHWPLPEDRPLCRLDDFVLRVTQPTSGVHYATEVAGSVGLLLAARLAKVLDAPILYVVADSELARTALADARFHLQSLDQAVVQGDTVRTLIPAEEGPYSELYPDRKTLMAQTASLARLAQSDAPRILIAPASALARRVLPKEMLQQATQRLRLDQFVDREALTRSLSQRGYLRLPIVEDPGTFAVRGGIVDLWSPDSASPVRVELEGDVVIRMRDFDPGSQRTASDRADYLVVPARARISTPEIDLRVRNSLRALCDAMNWPSSRARQLADEVADGRTFLGSEGFLPAYADLVPLLDYFAPNACVIFEDAPTCVKAIRQEIDSMKSAEASFHDRPHFGIDSWEVSSSQLVELLACRRVVALLHSAQAGHVGETELDFLELTPNAAPSFASTGLERLLRGDVAAASTRGQPSVERLASLTQTWHSSGFEVFVTGRSTSQLDRLSTLLGHRGVPVQFDAQSPETAAAGAMVVHLRLGPLARGAVLPLERLVFVTEEEVFSHRTHAQRQPPSSPRAPLMDLRSLAPDDFVVHEEHGIGRYLGLQRRPVDGVPVEFLVIEYDGGKLYLPVHRLNQVQKHASSDVQPKLDRLGGISFAKTKVRIQRRLRQLADDLLRLYSERLLVKRRPVPPIDDDYSTFEASFPFEETRDQATAIAEVLADMDSDKVMDRLVCGDVGFGKTEVALRAAFRTAMAGRQVGVLCPTTVLTQQHLLTFRTRLADFGLEVRALSRLVKASDVTRTLEGLKRGTVDVVIGTHRLLSKDVFFKDLGLLVVDEEQRFGVAHKERIKQLRKEVDVLTLSATPIPRTLQMALGGLRELSVIETPPVDRRPIRTIIARPDPDLVAQAIRNELSRGGQVFYVYNRISGLDERAKRIKSVVPEARVAVAHGQMRPNTLERTMLRFVSGELDVLVSTAIVESGLDIPRANTMLVDRADLFGLSQLYQLRGRIGRASERAYCYLLIPSLSELEPEARARLETIERFTELGVGLRVAAMDMEIRGTGDLLGAEQSGFVSSIGFELFCRMLEDAASEARGETVVHDVDPDLSVDVEALIPEDYVADVGIRLGYYKLLAGAKNPESVDDAAAEMEDRFGQPPPETRHLFALMRLKPELRQLKALGCNARANCVSLSLRADTPVTLNCVAELARQTPGAYRVTPDARLVRQARQHERFEHGIAHTQWMLDELKGCLDLAVCR
jgi:transcription-repair coupling factor (superfamily II helicase)